MMELSSDTSVQSSVHQYPSPKHDGILILKDNILKPKFEKLFKNAIEHKAHKLYKKMKAVSYKQELGLPVYHVKYEVGEGSYMHAEVAEIREFEEENRLFRYKCISIDENKGLDDQINCTDSIGPF